MSYRPSSAKFVLLLPKNVIQTFTGDLLHRKTKSKTVLGSKQNLVELQHQSEYCVNTVVQMTAVLQQVKFWRNKSLLVWMQNSKHNTLAMEIYS